MSINGTEEKLMTRNNSITHYSIERNRTKLEQIIYIIKILVSYRDCRSPSIRRNGYNLHAAEKLVKITMGTRKIRNERDLKA